MSTIKINVTENEINNGNYGDASSCMVAKAFRRKLDLPEGVDVRIGVSDGSNWITAGKHRIDVRLPKDVQEKIRTWDENDDLEEDQDQRIIKPFEFEVEFPDDWREQLGK